MNSLKKIKAQYDVTKDGYMKIKNKEDISYLKELLHERKCNCNIQDFYLRKERNGHLGLAFIYLRIKINNEFFAFPRIKKDDKVNGYINMFKNAIISQLELYRDLALQCEKLTCPITGEVLSDKNTRFEYETLSFKQILKNFLKEHNLSLDRLNENIINSLLYDWADYHYDNCQVKLVSYMQCMEIEYDMNAGIPITEKTPAQGSGVRKKMPCQIARGDVDWMTFVKGWMNKHHMSYFQAITNPKCKVEYEALKVIYKSSLI